MTQSKIRRKVFRVLTVVAVIYLLAAVTVFFCQRRLLYFPNQLPLPLAVQIAKRSGLEPWNGPSGELIGWRKLSQTNASHHRILITHGNAGSAIDRVDYAGYINEAEPCDVYILEYPGYGPRAGSPSQESLFRVADDAMTLLEKDGPIYLVGESLGTGVAAYLAGTHPKNVAAVLLIAPYHNLGDVAQSHMQIFPARYMLLDKFPSAEYLQKYHGPLAVLLAGQDEVVPNVPAAWWKELVAFWKQ